MRFRPECRRCRLVIFRKCGWVKYLTDNYRLGRSIRKTSIAAVMQDSSFNRIRAGRRLSPGRSPGKTGCFIPQIGYFDMASKGGSPPALNRLWKDDMIAQHGSRLFRRTILLEKLFRFGAERYPDGSSTKR